MAGPNEHPPNTRRIPAEYPPNTHRIKRPVNPAPQTPGPHPGPHRLAPACPAPTGRVAHRHPRRWPGTLAVLLIALTAAVTPMAAQAWWNADWTQRTRLTLDTSAKGVATKEAVAAMPLAIRLHSGNFDFLGSQPDGNDLRVLAADDKTVLPHRVERFDASNELAVIWVQLPSVAPGSDKNTVFVYAGNAKAPAAAPGQPMDGATLAAVHFDDAGNQGADSVAAGGAGAAGAVASGASGAAGAGGPGTAASSAWRSAAPITPEPNALLAGGARLTGTALLWPASERVKIAAGGAVTLSVWLRPDAGTRGTLLAWGPITLALADGKASATVSAGNSGGAAKTTLAGGSLAPTAWSHLALVLGGGTARLLVNGAEVAQANAATPALGGALRIGDGLRGAIDELQIANTARSADWLALAAASQGSDGRLIKALKESPEQASGESPGYIGILVKNLTVDAWVIIVILGILFVLALVVMVSKLRYIGRADRENRQFLGRFRAASSELLTLDQAGAHPHSSLFRLYAAGQRELKKRRIGEPGAAALGAASLNAVKASVDADLVRESHHLNAHMVWLTIAISGGPFLGLLGTVVGVMITFAAIAAAGDVNVNAIAPGIAAALLATVAGLAVAIPALFGYNYLASRIKNISADMQIFVDEFVTRVAEEYGARYER